VVQERVDVLDDLEYALVPLLVAERLPRRVADILVVGLVLVDRVLCELEMRSKRAIAEDCAADAGTECQDDLEPVPLDDAESLDLGVVEQARRLAQTMRQSVRQRIANPAFALEVRRRNDPAIPHNSRKADGNAVVGRERRR